MAFHHTSTRTFQSWSGPLSLATCHGRLRIKTLLNQELFQQMSGLGEQPIEVQALGARFDAVVRLHFGDGFSAHGPTRINS